MSGNGVDTTLTETQEHAEKLGLHVWLPGPCEVYLDVDGPPGSPEVTMVQERINATKKLLRIESGTWRLSKSGNVHVTLVMDRVLSAYERIAIMAILGSDSTQAALCLAQARVGHPEPSVFFEKEPQAPLSATKPEMVPSSGRVPATLEPLEGGFMDAHNRLGGTYGY